MQKNEKICNVLFFSSINLLGSFNRNFAEFLEVLHEFKGVLAGAGTSGFVTLYYLGFCILCKFCCNCIDFFNKLFHDFLDLLVR